MNFVKKLFLQDDKFFILMEQSAEEARAGILDLVALIRKGGVPQRQESLAQHRQEDKRITRTLTEELCSAFNTPIEREDIAALTRALYRVTKMTHKFYERYQVAGAHAQNMDLSRYLVLLEKAADLLVEIVRELRQALNIDKVRALNKELQQIEGEADKLMTEALRGLYNGDSAVQAVVRKDLHEVLEKVFDRCRDTGNLVFQITLKNA